MTFDWATVAATIEEHMTRLGLNQRELSERSDVALSIVRELRTNSIQRQRNRHILEALSLALGLHPRHLHAIATRQPPPGLPRPSRPPTASLPHRLTRIEERLDEIASQIGELNTKVSGIVHPIGAVTGDAIGPNREI